MQLKVFSKIFFEIWKVCTDVGGIKVLNYGCPHVREIIHLFNLVDYLHIQADKPLRNDYFSVSQLFSCESTMFSFFNSIETKLIFSINSEKKREKICANRSSVKVIVQMSK